MMQLPLFCARCSASMEYCEKRQRAACPKCENRGGKRPGAPREKTLREIQKEHVTPAQQAIIDAHVGPRKPRTKGGLGILKQEEIPESVIQDQIMKCLHREKWLVVRFNSGGSKIGGQWVKCYRIFALLEVFASEGLPDVIAFRGSRFLMIEVKDRLGRLRPAQARFIELAQRFNIKVHVCRSWQEAETIALDVADRQSKKPTRERWLRLLATERLARLHFGEELDGLVDDVLGGSNGLGCDGNDLEEEHGNKDELHAVGGTL